MFPFRITSEFKTSEHESRVSLLIEYSSSQQVALAPSLKIQGTLYVDVIVKFGADRSIGYSRKVRWGGGSGGRGTTSHRFLDACRLKEKNLLWTGVKWYFIIGGNRRITRVVSTPSSSSFAARGDGKMKIAKPFFFLSLISFPTFERKIVFVDYHIRTITEKRN